jgi:hypothetical protein
VYGVSVDHVIGSALDLQYSYNKEGQGILVRPPKLLLNNNLSGKPEDMYLFLGRIPKAAFGNSTGDQQMLEFAKSGIGASLAMLVYHDDAKREYAYGPAGGLPDTKIGAFSQPLVDEAKEKRLDHHQHEERLETHFRFLEPAENRLRDAKRLVSAGHFAAILIAFSRHPVCWAARDSIGPRFHHGTVTWDKGNRMLLGGYSESL